MVKNNKVPDYYKVIPESLWENADDLVSYVRYFPYAKPKECPYCGYHAFYETKAVNTVGQPRYICDKCKRNFSQLTGSYFTQMKHGELWPDFVSYRLSGLSNHAISLILNISQSRISMRDKKLCLMMQDLFPSLYQWWKPHQDFADKRMTVTVRKERSKLIKWFSERMIQQATYCPQCGQYIKQRSPNGVKKNRPYFRCTSCSIGFSAFTNTPFNWLFHKELWKPIIKGICEGKSNRQIVRALPNTSAIIDETISNWRNKTIEQIKQMELNELLYWLEWQRSRNKGVEAHKARTKNKTK